MTTKAVCDREICPFTCETSHDCYAARTVSGQQECPFTLEPCHSRIEAARWAQRKQRPHDARALAHPDVKKCRDSVAAEAGLSNKG